MPLREKGKYRRIINFFPRLGSLCNTGILMALVVWIKAPTIPKNHGFFFYFFWLLALGLVLHFCWGVALQIHFALLLKAALEVLNTEKLEH
jgi:hypothetical protein